MLDVSQIMKDLASLVHEQGASVGKNAHMCVCVFVYVSACAGPLVLLSPMPH